MIVSICSGIGIINNFEILDIGKDTYRDKVNVQINELIKNIFQILFPHSELNIINTIQLRGIA